MVFSSYSFIFFFMPLVLAGFFLILRYLGGTPAKVWLAAASLFFYAQGSPIFLLLLTGTVVFNYFMLRLIKKYRKNPKAARSILAAAVVENLGLLFYFKYMNFFLKNVNLVFGTDYILRNIALPLGISFFTFQILSCVIEYYRGEAGDSSFLEFALLVTFFPKLIVGPIAKHDSIMEQLRSPAFSNINMENIMRGIMLFSVGCAKKTLIADPLIAHAQNFYNVMGNGNFFEAWGAVVSYTFAYYFDFSGYIDIAIGLGLFSISGCRRTSIPRIKPKTSPTFGGGGILPFPTFTNTYLKPFSNSEIGLASSLLLPWLRLSYPGCGMAQAGILSFGARRTASWCALRI